MARVHSLGQMAISILASLKLIFDMVMVYRNGATEVLMRARFMKINEMVVVNIRGLVVMLDFKFKN